MSIIFSDSKLNLGAPNKSSQNIESLQISLCNAINKSQRQCVRFFRWMIPWRDMILFLPTSVQYEKKRIRMWNGIIVKNIKWSKCIALWKFFFSCAWVSGVIVIISFYIIKTCRWIHPLQLQITRIDLYRLPVSRFGCVFVFSAIIFPLKADHTFFVYSHPDCVKHKHKIKM